ncbi:hypothetical protein HK101_010030 [Irineochytrium annulatum]|nr:hypothetical protein HK101_010030 [Irineochytrium annulatum]
MLSGCSSTDCKCAAFVGILDCVGACPLVASHAIEFFFPPKNDLVPFCQDNCAFAYDYVPPELAEAVVFTRFPVPSSYKTTAIVVPAVLSACVAVVSAVGFFVYRRRRARKKVVGEDVELVDKLTPTSSTKPLPNIPATHPPIESKLFRRLEASTGTHLVVEFKQREEPCEERDGGLAVIEEGVGGPSNTRAGTMWEKRYDVRTWMVEDVCAWLLENDFSLTRIEAFRANGVDGAMLLQLSDQQMADDLRMTSAGAREMLRVLIARLTGGGDGGGPSGDPLPATEEAAPPPYVAR